MVINRWLSSAHGSLAAPERDESCHDDDEVNLSEERLEHGERLAHVARGHQIAIPDGCQRGIAEEEVVIPRRVRYASKEGMMTEQSQGTIE